MIILRGKGKSFCAGLELGPENELIGAISGPPGATQKIGIVQKCSHDVDRDCEAYFLKTFSKRCGVGGQIDTVSQKTY